MGFPDGQAAYEQKKLELHAKLDQTKKVSPATVSLVRSRLERLSHPSPTKKPRPYMPPVKIIFFPYMPIIFVMQDKCLF